MLYSKGRLMRSLMVLAIIILGSGQKAKAAFFSDYRLGIEMRQTVADAKLSYDAHSTLTESCRPRSGDSLDIRCEAPITTASDFNPAFSLQKKFKNPGTFYLAFEGLSINY